MLNNPFFSPFPVKVCIMLILVLLDLMVLIMQKISIFMETADYILNESSSS